MATLDEPTRDTLRIQVGNARFEPPIVRTGSDAGDTWTMRSGRAGLEGCCTSCGYRNRDGL